MTTLDRVRVSDITTFRECRRRWYLSRIERLEPKLPPIALWFGDTIHWGLRKYHNLWIDLGERPKAGVDDVIAAYDEYVDQSFLEFRIEYGEGFWNKVLPEYEAMIPLGQGMLRNYIDFDHEDAQPWTAKEVEAESEVTIEDVTIVAHLDVLFDSPSGEVVVDHKGYNRKPSFGTALDLDPQLTGYAWIRWKLTGKLPSWLVYNVLMKRLPQPPKQLQSGMFSRDKRKLGSTTEALFRETVEAAGRNPKAYRDILAALRERGWSSFFMRAGTQRNEAQVRSWEKHSLNTIEDMRLVIEEPALAYPSPSQMRCPWCPFLELCLTLEEDSDVDAVIEAKFFQREASDEGHEAKFVVHEEST